VPLYPAQKQNLTVDTSSNEVEEMINKQVHETLQTLLRASLLLSAIVGKYQDVIESLAHLDPVDPLISSMDTMSFCGDSRDNFAGMVGF
jgi:hypothetical protein